MGRLYFRRRFFQGCPDADCQLPTSHVVYPFILLKESSFYSWYRWNLAWKLHFLACLTLKLSLWHSSAQEEVEAAIHASKRRRFMRPRDADSGGMHPLPSGPSNFSCLQNRNTAAVSKWSPPKPEDENHDFELAEEIQKVLGPWRICCHHVGSELSSTAFLLFESKI